MSRNAKGNGNIRKIERTRNGKKQIIWQARYTAGRDPVTGKQIQRSLYAQTQKEAAQKLKEITLSIDNGTYIAPSKMTVGEWFDTWQKDYTNDIKESTSYLYKRTIKLYVTPHLGEVRLDKLDSHMIQVCYNELLHPKDETVKPISPKTVKNVHGVLHKGLQQAVDNGYLSSNPTNACKLPKIERAELHLPDESLIAAFLKEIQGHQYEHLYTIALLTGLRESEVLGLTWESVDLDNGTLTVKQQLRRGQEKGRGYYISSTKNGKTRILALSPSVINAFKLQKLQQEEWRDDAGELWTGNKDGMVFTNRIGEYLSYRTVYDCFKRIVKRLGSPKTRFHDLRHAYAMIALKSGVDMETVKENLGHSTSDFTARVYAYSTNEMKRDGANKVEAFIQSLT